MTNGLADRLAGTTDPEPFRQIARRTFIAWEKLRLIYLFVLAAVTLFLLEMFRLTTEPAAWFDVMAGTVVANILYLLGPACETYVRWLGAPARAAIAFRVVAFVIGTMIAVVLAFAAFDPRFGDGV